MSAKHSTPTPQLEPSRFEEGRPLILAGLMAHYDCRDVTGIPGQWARFSTALAGKLPMQIGAVTYGVSVNGTADGDFDYLCAVEIEGSAALPPGLTQLEIPAQRYAVFRHSGPVSTLAHETRSIFGSWLPQSGYAMTGMPDVMERYSADFDPGTNKGSVEIWLPIQRPGDR